MLVVKTVKKLEDGTYDVNWNLSDDQMSFLLTYAINSLMAQGLLDVEEEHVTEAQMELQFLEDVDPDDMHQA